MGDPAIRVEGLSKQYRIGVRRGHDTLRDAITSVATAPVRALRGFRGHAGKDDTIWALRDVSFEVEPGEVVGIIGRNGAGKSTLLKILTRITEPTGGRAELRGRVGSLLEVGTGFHPELTGRENIYLSGAVLGMTRREITARLDAIIDFSGVEKFIDTPVKRYSSGMHVRLGFAVAAHLEPEILLVDEVLAVGDAEFQKKCLGKMDTVARAGRTILFVSHNMAAIQSLCSRALVFGDGRKIEDGPAEQSIGHYLRNMAAGTAASGPATVDIRPDARRFPGSIPLIYRIRILDGDGNGTDSVLAGGEIIVEFSFRSKETVRPLGIGLGIDSPVLGRIVSFSNYLHAAPGVPLEARSGTARFRIPALPLVPGQYFLTPSVCVGSVKILDVVEQCIGFHVLPAPLTGGTLMPAHGQGILCLPAEIALEETERSEKSEEGSL